MDFQTFVQQTVDFVRHNQAWAVPVVFALAFGESLAFISLLLPAWGALVAIGALIGSSGIKFWPIWVAASLGAAFGDWVSYWIGLKLEYRVAHMWPLSRHPDLIPRGETFMTTTAINTTIVELMTSRRVGHATLRISALTSPRYWRGPTFSR